MSPRLFIRSLCRITVFENPFFRLFQHSLEVFRICRSYPAKTREISADVEKNSQTLLKAKDIIKMSDMPVNFFKQF